MKSVRPQTVSSKVEPLPSIPELIQSCEGAILRAHTALADLEVVLSPVLKPAPEDSACRAAPPADSQLRVALYVHLSTVGDLARRIDELRQRVDL